MFKCVRTRLTGKRYGSLLVRSTPWLVGETGAHWDINQSSGLGPKNMNITTSDYWLWESLTFCPCYVSTSTLLCNHGWCENLFRNVSQLSHCAPYLGHIGTRGGAHWDYMLVKENKCKLGGRYIFENKVQTKNLRQPACRINLKQYCQNNIWVKLSFIWIWNVQLCYQYGVDIGEMSHCAPKTFVPMCPTCSWKSN